MALKLKTKQRQLVTLDLAAGRKGEDRRPLDISCVAQLGRHLWIGSDETVQAGRLTWDAKQRQFGEHRAFDLTKLFSLPGGRREEIDIEGMAVAPPYLWITGSHSLTRGKAEGRTFEDAIADLTEIQRETNRYFLARIPLVESSKAPGDYELQRTGAGSRASREKLTASRLFGTGATSVMTDALRFDELLRPYIELPGKDNGLDVEGLAVDDDRVLLGLRGPVLRGWAVLLELEPEYFCDGYFTLAAIGKQGKLYRRHFLDLRGLGIRDLERIGNDLLILAGPTMAIDGRVVLLRWKDFHKRKKEAVVPREELEVLLDFGGGDIGRHGENHPEGLTLFTPPDDCDLPRGLLITYDTPAGRYRKKHGRVQADLFPFAG